MIHLDEDTREAEFDFYEHDVEKLDEAEILAIELDETVTRDCTESTPFTRGRLVVIVRLLEQAIDKNGA